MRPYSRRYRDGTNQIVTVNVQSGAVAYHAPAPHRSISDRGNEGPVWSPDGSKWAIVMGGVLWTLAVDGDGCPIADPVAVTDEIADAPTWRGDSQALLYLSAGELRILELSDGTTHNVPFELSSTIAIPRGRTIVHAGRYWDGVARGLSRDAAIVIEGDRITAVTDESNSAALDADARHVHVSDLTVIPGLIDMHVHAHMRGRFLGARQGRLWLSFGVTTIRGPGDPAYAAAQERESVAAGVLIAPRYFGAGEAIDGRRVHYNCMRSTVDNRELDREIVRAGALNYDLVKLYVRLPWDRAERAFHDARRSDKWVTSHYLYPAALFGHDGIEHLFGNNRLGYSQTSTFLNRSYDDVTALIDATGMAVTPTLFSAACLFAENPDLVGDERVLRLYPPWEYQSLLQKVAMMRDDPEWTAQLRDGLASMVGTLQRIQEGRGMILAGTDAPLDHTAVSLHMNLRAMVKFGMSTYDVLRSATANAAEALGWSDKLGAIAPGMLADLVFVEGDPLVDIKAVAAVRRMMAAGTLYETADLLDIPINNAQSVVHEHSTPLVNHPQFWWHPPASVR